MTTKSQQKLAPWIATLVLIAVWWLAIRVFDVITPGNIRRSLAGEAIGTLVR